MELIVTTREQIESIIHDAVLRAVHPQQRTEPEPNQFGIDGLLSYLEGKNLVIAKSFVYKMVHLDRIPHSKFLKQLVFDKKEIDQWISDNTKKTASDINATLAKSANRKNRA